jgi:O-antigen/teichoic acid export membrane protein
MNFWQICGSLVGLGGVLAGIHLHAGLPFLVAALAGAPVLATVLNSIHFFVFSRADLGPRFRFVSRDAVSHILSVGSMFFVMQMVIAVAYSADNVFIDRTMGAASVPGYSIPQRMFALITMVVTMLIMPLWPAYGEAIARGDLEWARRTLKRSLVAVFGGTVIASAALLLIAHRLIAWWVGPSISPPFVLLLGLAGWVVVECCGNTLSVFLNGAGIIRFQAIMLSIFGVACLVLKVFFIRRFGIVAVPWATLLTYVPVVGIACAIFLPRAMKHLHPSPNLVTIASPVIED